MSVKLLAEHHLEFLSLKGGCTGSSESTLVKMPHCWKLHVTAQLFYLLLPFRCDVNIINGTGQTALDIAMFWNHSDVAKQLRSEAKGQHPDDNLRNYFSLNNLNRCSDKRKDKTWLRNKMLQENTKFILFSNLNALVCPLKEKKQKWRYNLARIERKQIEQHLASNPVCIFLGLVQENKHIPLTFEEEAVYAVDVSEVEESKFLSLIPDSEFIPGYPAAMQLQPAEAGIYAEARSMLAWHDRYQFCPTCGTKTMLEEGGYKRSCPDQKCRSNEGNPQIC